MEESKREYRIGNMTVKESYTKTRGGWWYIAAYYHGSMYCGSFQEFRKEKK